MSNDIDDLSKSAVARWRDGKDSLAALVAGLEFIVNQAERDHAPNASLLRRAWGQLEIINALQQDAGESTEHDSLEVQEFVKQFQEFAAGQ